MPRYWDSLETTVVQAIAAACPVAAAPITRSTRLLDAGMDSLTLVTVLCQIEIAYGVTFATDDLADLLRAREVGDLVAAVARKLDSTGS